MQNYELANLAEEPITGFIFFKVASFQGSSANQFSQRVELFLMDCTPQLFLLPVSHLPYAFLPVCSSRYGTLLAWSSSEMLSSQSTTEMQMVSDSGMVRANSQLQP